MLTGKCGQVVLKLLQEEKAPEELVLFVIQWCIEAIMKSPDISQVELLRVLQFLFKTEFSSHVDVLTLMKICILCRMKRIAFLRIVSLIMYVLTNLFQLIDNVLKVLRIPLESESKVILPDELLLHRLYCIRAVIPMMNPNHIEKIKDMLLELMEDHLGNLKPEVNKYFLIINKMGCILIGTFFVGIVDRIRNSTDDLRKKQLLALR